MTTFPGKPPNDEASDSNWESPEGEAEREVAAASSDDATPVYGVGVPYGGNDRTEEVEPIALDMPFSPEERKPAAAAPAAAAPAPAPVVARRTPTPRPLDAPAQLALSDLFDSTPPPSSLVPPDPAAFSSPPPAPKSRWSKEPKPTEPRAADPAAPWTVSRPSGDAQYFASGPAVSPTEGSPAEGPPATRSPSAPPPGSLRPEPSASLRPEPPASLRPEPSTSGGVVALPSINVLAAPQPQLPRPDSRRASAPPASTPAVDRADLIDDFKATLPRPISLKAPGRVALLDDLQETAPRPIAGRSPGSSPPAPPAMATPGSSATASAPAVATPAPAPVEPSSATPSPSGVEPPASGVPSNSIPSSSVYLDEPDPTSKVFVDSLPDQLLSEEDATPLPSEPPPPVAPNPASPLRSSPRASPAPASALDDDLKATLQRPLPSRVQLEAAHLQAAQLQAAQLESEEIEPTTQRRSESEPPQRRSVPTLESVGNAAARARGASVDAGISDEIARIPSEVPTSRPPDVLLGAAPESASGERKSRPGGQRRSSPPGERRAPNPPPQAVLAMLPSTKTQQISLPSIMLADDVEAEHDSAAQRRALRAARQTVRIELPANFGRPGSAMLPGLSPGTSTALPLPESERTPRSTLKRYAPWGLAGLLLLLALMLFVMRPRSGSLVVTALGAGHRGVESVQIFVDGKPLCDSSPCRISGLSAGAHKLRATAPGLSSEEQTVEIVSGEESATNIELNGAEPGVQAGGLRIAAAEREFTLYVDDRRVGKLPQTVSGLAAGKHWIKLDPEDGSPAIEKSVNVQAGSVLDVDPRPARRDKVVVTIGLSPDSEGASVTFDDAFLLDFPAELELEPRTQHTLTATKPGYEDYTLRVELGEETEKRIEVALTPLDGASPRPRARAKPSAAANAQAAARKSATPVTRPSSSSPADATQGLLNISSTPPSQIILNGRPLGSTPKTAVVVPGDSLQTIVFVHPKMGRRRAQKFVPAGKERTVSIRF